MAGLKGQNHAVCQCDLGPSAVCFGICQQDAAWHVLIVEGVRNCGKLPALHVMATGAWRGGRCLVSWVRQGAAVAGVHPAPALQRRNGLLATVTQV